MHLNRARALRAILAFVLVAVGLVGLSAEEETQQGAPAALLNRLAQSMQARHDGLKVVGIDPQTAKIELQMGEGKDARDLLLFTNSSHEALEDNDFFEHFEYQGYEFQLNGSNNLSALGAADGLIDSLDKVTAYFKSQKIEPEALQGRVRMLVAGMLVFQYRLAKKGAIPQYWIDGKVYSLTRSPWDKKQADLDCANFIAASKKLQEKIDADDANLSYGVQHALMRLVDVSSMTDSDQIEKASSDDQLTGGFCRLVITDHYFHKALGDKLTSFFRKELDDYLAACKVISAFQPRFVLTAADKSELIEYQNPWGNKLWTFFDAPTGETHLIIGRLVPDNEPKESRIYIHRIFDHADSHNLDAILAREDYKRLEVSFPFYGTLATYDVKTRKFSCDTARWDNAARALFSPNMKPIFLPPAEMFPPHIPIYRFDGSVEGMVVPKGVITLPDFALMPVAERSAAHVAFFQELADKLDTPGYLHILFQNLFQYVFDSPDAEFPDIIGNSVQVGDIHQTSDQTANRRYAGCILGDCDDMAEFYQRITRLQGRPSYVMGVPGHATCGWVTEKKVAETGDDNKKVEKTEYTLNFLDTGPARQLTGDNLDKLIEAGVRSYDQEGRMDFSPDEVEFLFRFAGEKTRTAYVLSTRMFVDPKYAETMIRVQSYWHYHTYNLGIKTMEGVLASGDRISANYFEVSSLYSQCRLWKNAFKRQIEGIAAIKKDDTLTNLSARIRLAEWYHEAKEDDEAVKVLTDLNKTLDDVPVQQLQRTLEFIMETGSIWKLTKHPYEGYEPLHRVMVLTGGRLFFPLAPGLVNLYSGMVDYNKDHTPTEEQQQTFKEVESILNRFYGDNAAMFQNSEGLDDDMQRYAALAEFYRARMGEKAFQQKLLQKDKLPAVGVRPSQNRDPSDPDSDWIIFHASYYTYLNEVGKALDDDDGDKKPDVQAALMWAQQALDAYKRQKQFTQSDNGGLEVKELQANVALLTGNWDALTKIYDDAHQQDYARHTLTLAASLGQLSKVIPLADFKKGVDLWDQHVNSKQYYYLIAYEALQAKSYEAADYAAQVVARRYPQDETMVNEAAALHAAIPVVRQWYEDRAAALKKQAEAEKKAAEAAKEKPPASKDATPAPKEATPAPVH
ncbi:MAG: hypothetical protein ACREJ2_00460 [Planctomycetota bacterium]